MITAILSFILTHFSEALLVVALGMFSKALTRQFGEDRTRKIKETILSAMLWAEEQFGIGHGTQKWTSAWNKIIEMLQKQGITLKDNEIKYVQDLIKSNVPVVNEITYSSLPDKARETRIFIRSPEISNSLKKLKNKYPTSKE